nr:radical SAM family heme chaperone HemW [Desulfobacula sp.]
MCNFTSIYIHIPFCLRKCAYCDFYSETRLALIPDFLKALEQEIGLRAPLCSSSAPPSPGPAPVIDTVYLGGGTPSLQSVGQIGQVLQTVRDKFRVSPDAEITVEINPGTVDSDYLTGLKGTGVNRLSIGVQSFDDAKLAFLGRIHTAKEAEKTIGRAETAGFKNISLDLIYGVPGETRAAWIRDMKKALDRNPSHISAYMLTLEPGTPLADRMKQGGFIPAGSEMMSLLFKMTSQYLTQNGFEHYEISNFSRGRVNRSRHNSRYWDLSPYLGFGPGAHSYDGAVRSWNYKNIQRYIADLSACRLPVEDRETLTPEQKMAEFIMLRLRTLEGIDLGEFRDWFHLPFTKRFETLLSRILGQDLGNIEDGRFFLNLEGRTFLNGIVEAFSAEIL